MNEFTVALIKPDAVKARKAGLILSAMERHYDVKEAHTAQWHTSFAEQFYAEHLGRPFFTALVDFMCSGPLYMIILQGEGVIQLWRQHMGATNPMQADPGSIRGRYASLDGVVMHNVVHGSDSAEAAEREMRLIRTQLHGKRMLPGGGGILPDFGGFLRDGGLDG